MECTCPKTFKNYLKLAGMATLHTNIASKVKNKCESCISLASNYRKQML